MTTHKLLEYIEHLENVITDAIKSGQDTVELDILLYPDVRLLLNEAGHNVVDEFNRSKINLSGSPDNPLFEPLYTSIHQPRMKTTSQIKKELNMVPDDSRFENKDIYAIEHGISHLGSFGNDVSENLSVITVPHGDESKINNLVKNMVDPTITKLVDNGVFINENVKDFVNHIAGDSSDVNMEVPNRYNMYDITTILALARNTRNNTKDLVLN